MLTDKPEHVIFFSFHVFVELPPTESSLPWRCLYSGSSNFRLFPLVRGEIFGTRVDAKSSTRSLETFASSPRKWQEAVSSRGVSLSVCHGRHPDVIYCMLVGEGLVRSGELSRSFSVCLSRTSPWRHRDAAVLARFLCKRANVAGKLRETSSLSSAFRKICRTKEKCLMQKCRRKRD